MKVEVYTITGPRLKSGGSSFMCVPNEKPVETLPPEVFHGMVLTLDGAYELTPGMVINGMDASHAIEGIAHQGFYLHRSEPPASGDGGVRRVVVKSQHFMRRIRTRVGK